MPRPKRLEWTAPALEDLAEGLAYVAEDSLAAAVAIKQRIDLAIHRIRRGMAQAEAGAATATHEFAVARTAYTLIFEERAESFVILHCWQQRRRPAAPV